MTACKHDKNIVNKLIVGYPGSFYIIQNNCVPYPQNKIIINEESTMDISSYTNDTFNTMM